MLSRSESKTQQQVFSNPYGPDTATAWWGAAVEVNARALEFTSRRAMAAASFPMSLAKCATPLDVAQAHVQFWTVFAQDCARASQKMANCRKKLSRDAAAVQQPLQAEPDKVVQRDEAPKMAPKKVPDQSEVQRPLVDIEAHRRPPPPAALAKTVDSPAPARVS